MSIEKKIKTIKKEWDAWPLSNQQWPPKFLLPDKAIDFHKMRQFIEFVNQQPHMTHGWLLTTILFVQHCLNEECVSCSMARPKGSVKGDDQIRKWLKDRESRKASFDLENGIDMQADLHRDIEPERMMSLIEGCLCPTTTKLQNTSLLAQLQTAAGICDTHHTGNRSNDLRNQRIGFLFTKKFKNIGPGQGTEIDMCLSNSGKVTSLA